MKRSLCIQCASANGCICETPVINFYLATRIHIRVFSYSFFFFYSSRSLIASERETDRSDWGDGWQQEEERRVVARGRKRGARARAVKRGTSPSRTSSPDEIKTLALVVGKMWLPRRKGEERAMGGKAAAENRGGNYCSARAAAPKTDVSCVARRKRRVSRGERLLF